MKNDEFCSFQIVCAFALRARTDQSRRSLRQSMILLRLRLFYAGRANSGLRYELEAERSVTSAIRPPSARLL